MTGFSDQSQANFADATAAGPLLRATVRLGPGGRVVIPVEMREALGLKQGDAMLASLENNELRLVTLAERVRELQAITNKYHPEGVSLVDELLAERRAKQAKEDSE